MDGWAHLVEGGDPELEVLLDRLLDI